MWPALRHINNNTKTRSNFGMSIHSHHSIHTHPTLLMNEIEHRSSDSLVLGADPSEKTHRSFTIPRRRNVFIDARPKRRSAVDRVLLPDHSTPTGRRSCQTPLRHKFPFADRNMRVDDLVPVYDHPNACAELLQYCLSLTHLFNLSRPRPGHRSRGPIQIGQATSE